MVIVTNVTRTNRPSSQAFERSSNLRSLVTSSVTDAYNARLLALPAFGSPVAFIVGIRDGHDSVELPVVVLTIEVGVFLQDRNASQDAIVNNAAALSAVRFLLAHATGSDLLSAFIASQTAQVGLATTIAEFCF